MDTLHVFLKSLANPSRLNIVGLLAQQSRSVDELAAILDLSASTVSQHLNRLQKAGLVSAQAWQYYHIYSLQSEAIDQQAALLTAEHLAQRVEENEAIDGEAYTQHILSKWVREDRLQAMPTQLKHRRPVLNWLLDKFERDRRYDEDQVWDRMGEWCAPAIADYSPIYRALVEEGLFDRVADGSWYWRTDSLVLQNADAFTVDLLRVASTPNINRHTIRRAALKSQNPDGAYADLEERPAPTTRRLKLLHVALRIRSRQNHTEAEIDGVIRLFSDGDVASVRADLLDEALLQLNDDGTYTRGTHLLP